MSSNNNQLEKHLWDAADELRANSKLRSHEYSVPVLGLVFLKWADFRFTHMKQELEKTTKKSSKRRREIGKLDYQAAGILYIPKEARFSHLMKLPEGADVGKAINDAMQAIENENEDLRGVLPRTYHRFDNQVLLSLLRTFNSIPMDVEGDVFGKVYEYFLGKFAMTEGQKGGEFFTPTALVRLIVEIIEPFHGRIYDPACGSGGMFVQSARFVKAHKKNPSEEISVYGQERVDQTVRLCKMNMAVHGLAGDIREGNSYYEDIHESVGKFDFVMANPPFNVDKVDKERIKDDSRFGLGIPRVDNANYLWIQIFYSTLNEKGRAGFVMANSASDARSSELEVRKKLLADDAVDVVISIGSNFFYTVTLPCTLWFLDRGKKGSEREKKILFIDAREVYRQIDRAHRDFTPSQIEFLSNIVKLYRGERPDFNHLGKSERGLTYDSIDEWKGLFPEDKYEDVSGLCRVASMDEIEEQGWSLNPGRYVGVAEVDEDDGDFYENLTRLRGEFDDLTKEAHKLEKSIKTVLDNLLEGEE
ncbi:MAG: class I SAM-dependent DNA methyltransferase [Candidatus Thorarchaeota archaeon]